jgi:hypothetical protein
MPDATERGGAMASVYRQMKTKEGGVIRIDKEKVLAESKKASLFKGNGRNQPMANVMGPDKNPPKGKGY